MHELGLCEAILHRVEERAGDRPVARVRVRVGRLHHVHPEAFEQSFSIAAAGGVAEEAVAELVLVPVRAGCRACGTETEADEQVLACPACGSVEVEITAGDELTLESIEYVAMASRAEG
ncbi:MAG: hydrogenase maturation nickel metallochaperone HypA [Acidimicrobiia bacterium]|nr:hydrogenase maturation nickel metallochaperone HypA [Acidimicrobiia bacterium]